MTAAQRRTATIKIGGEGHQVEITADVAEPADLVKLAVSAYHETHKPRGHGIGFGAQVERGPVNLPTAGSPWHAPATAKGGENP